jgi:hypothetical protein
METTKREYLEQKHSELFESLGCFFAFNNKQFNEGITKAGGLEVTGKYFAVGSGLYCPTKNAKKLLEGIERIKDQWESDRKKVKQIRMKWVGVDNWNRPVWKAPDKREYYGSVTQLFSYDATEEEVLKEVETYDLVYMGNHFGCEPMGTGIPDKYYI